MDAKLALYPVMDKNAVLCTMKILLAAATEAEIAPLTELISATWKPSGNGVNFEKNGHVLHVLITGVGLTAATYSLTKALLQQQYDFAIQAGIAGAFDCTLPLCSVVSVATEQYGDFGAEDHDKFLDVFSLGLINPDEPPFKAGILSTPDSDIRSKTGLPEVSSLTIHTVSGNEKTIADRTERNACQIESMEGAAFHYVCLKEGVDFVQIRAISNYVEPRDKSKWKIGEAIEKLNEWLADFIEKI